MAYTIRRLIERAAGSIALAALVIPLAWSGNGAAPGSEQPVGMVEQPCPEPLAVPPQVRSLLEELFVEPRRLMPSDFDRLLKNPQFAAFNATARARAVQDWPGLCRYRSANASTLAAATPVRVVFMGDSITENWALADPAFFAAGVVNRGIGGQTTGQMLLRFRADVIALQPQVVHILAGTNDIAGNTGPTSAQDFKNNILSMVEMARKHGIRVLLGAIPPAAVFGWQPHIDPRPRVRELNDWLRTFALSQDIEFIDYYTPLAGASAELQAGLGNDGVHPNRDGYRVMRSVVEQAISRDHAGAMGHWVSTWATAQQLAPGTIPKWARPPPEAPPMRARIAPIPGKLQAETVRMVARISIGGQRVRVQLSNAQGTEFLPVGAAHIALLKAGSTVIPESDRALTFGGRSAFEIPPGAVIVSDPVELAVADLSDVAISLYLPKQVAALTVHPLGLRTTYITSGDATARETLTDARQCNSYLWLTGIEVAGPTQSAAIVALGDSITDGFATTPDANSAWPALLAARLLAGSSPGAPTWSALNLGISGNRVLRDGAGASALARFDRDVLSRPGVRWVILLEGINDISVSSMRRAPATEHIQAEDLIAGLRLLVEKAHTQGIRVMGATLLPWEGVWTYTDTGEAIRQAVNQWIRTGGMFDSVVDFDTLTRDPAQPSRLRPEFDSGDHVHPNDAGNRALADAIELSIFNR